MYTEFMGYFEGEDEKKIGNLTALIEHPSN
jgi:hypothetical protein